MLLQNCRSPVVIIKLVLGNVALAAIVGALYHCRRDNIIHCKAAEKVSVVLASQALSARELRKACAMFAIALHKFKIIARG